AVPAAGFAAPRPNAQVAARPSGTVPLHQSNVTVDSFGIADCSDFAPDQPTSGQEGWVFQAPADGGRLRTVRLRFAVPGGVLEVTLDAAAGGVWSGGSGLFDNGTELWLPTPTGWTLLDGVAEVPLPTVEDFNLIRPCRRPNREAAAEASGATAAT